MLHTARSGWARRSMGARLAYFGTLQVNPPTATYQAIKPNGLIRYMSQTHLPQPFGLSLSKPGRSLRATLRQAQGERVI